jgi:PAS domain S-box-containing protein
LIPLPPSVDSRIRQLWAAVALLCAVVIGINVVYLYFARDVLVRDALQRVEFHARVLEIQSSRAVSGVGLTLRAVAEAVKEWEPRSDPARSGRWLADQIAGQPLLRSLSLVAPDGTVVASSSPANVGLTVPLEPLGCFTDPATDERIGDVLAVRDLAELVATGTSPVPVSALPMRRMARTHAGAETCIVALLNPERFVTEYELLLDDPSTRSALLAFDGKILSASSGIQKAPGTRVPELAPLAEHLPRRERGQYEGAGIDGDRVLAGFRASRAWPLLTVVEQSPAVVTRHLISEAVWPATATLAVMLFIIAAGLAEQFTLKREAKAQALADSLGREVALSEARFRAIFEQAGVGMLQQGADGRLLSVNPALCKLLGYTPAELLALQPGSLVHPDDLEQSAGTLLPASAGDLAPAVGELRLRNKNGAWLWVRMTTSLASDASGQQLTIGVVEDISARRQAQLELVDARLHELDIGARIQRSLLVPPPDAQLPGLWLSAFSLASQGIDGDFVEVMPMGAHCVDIIAGDVMGKGLSAALLGAAVKMLFSRCITELLTDPARDGALPSPEEVVSAVHAATTPNLQALESFVTLCYLRIDTRAGTLTWVGCGHEEPLLVRAAGGCVSLANQHPPVGVLDHVDYTQQTVPFGRRDGLFLFSDGIVDAFRPDGERIGRERLAAAVEARMQVHATPAAIVHALRRDLLGEGVRFTDDVTMLLAMRADDPEHVARREFPTALGSVPAVREMVETRSRQLGLDETTASLFSVACVEAFTNIVRHARGGVEGAPTEVVTRCTDDALLVDFVHQGDAFAPPDDIEAPPLEGFPQGGFGLAIMRDASDGVVYLHDDGVNTIRLTKLRSPGPR